MARPIRIEYPGAVYHVICRGNNRQAIYRDDQDRRRYLEKLSYYCQDKTVHLLAYCLMPNHVHLLLESEKRGHSSFLLPDEQGPRLMAVCHAQPELRLGDICYHVINRGNGSAGWVSRMAAQLGLGASLRPRGRPRKEIEI